MAPVYVEMVKFVESKTNLPIKVALRDAEPIYNVAMQMAKIRPEQFGHIPKKWSTVWLTRMIVHRFDTGYEDRDMDFYSHESKVNFDGQKNLLKQYISSRHLDEPFAFIDTGINGGMSKVLNQRGIKNTPLFVVSCDAKYNYKALDLDDEIASYAHGFDAQEPEFWEHGHKEALIDLLDGIPHRTTSSMSFTKDLRPLTYSRSYQEIKYRNFFDKGLQQGVIDYMNNTPDNPMECLAHTAVHIGIPLLNILHFFLELNPPNNLIIPGRFHKNKIDDYHKTILELHRNVYGYSLR